MPPVGLPLVHEEDVDGVVSSVSMDTRTRMPFVTGLFKPLSRQARTMILRDRGTLSARTTMLGPGLGDRLFRSSSANYSGAARVHVLPPHRGAGGRGGGLQRDLEVTADVAISRLVPAAWRESG